MRGLAALEMEHPGERTQRRVPHGAPQGFPPRHPLTNASSRRGRGRGGALRHRATCARRWGADALRFVGCSQERRHPMNLGAFIDTFKEAIAQRVVESYPPLFRPSENGGTLPRLLRKPLGGAGRRHQGRGPLPRSPPGHHRGRRDGHGQDLHRRRSSAHGGLPEDADPLPAAPGAEVEAGGGDDGARRARRHRQVHHRPGAAAPLRRLRPPLRGDEP